MPSMMHPTGDAGLIIALVPDVFFGVTVRNAILRLGYEAALIRNTGQISDALEISEPVLLIVDMTAVGEEPGGWAPIKEIAERGVRVLAFGPHRETELFRIARDAGVSRVVANSQFHRRMGELIQRYALESRAEADLSPAGERRERPAADEAREEGSQG